MLYLQRHDIQLRIFPEGKFLHEIITATEAKNLIDKAISENNFLGTFNHDNANPDRANKKFQEFLDAMKKHCDITFSLDNFFSEAEDEGEIIHFGHTPGLFTLKDDDVLIVVDYCFSLLPTPKNPEDFDLDKVFKISPDTIKFHKFSLEN